MARKKRKPDRWIQNVALLLITILVSLLFLEIVLRFVYPQNISFVKFDPQIGSVHVPGFDGWIRSERAGEFLTRVHINSKGLRDQEYAYEKEGGVVRVLALGASVAFGEGVPLEGVFTEIIERQLNEGEKRYEILNGAVRGYSIGNAFLFLEHEGVVYDPDVILLTITAGGGDAFLSTELQEHISEGKEFTEESVQLKARRFLARHSHIYVLLIKILKSNHVTNEFLINRGIFATRPVPYYLMDDNELEEKLEETLSGISLFEDYAAATGTRLIVILMPLADQIYPELLNQSLAAHSADQPPSEILMLPRQMISDYLVSRGVEYVDMYDDFTQAREKVNLYYAFNRHPTHAAHAIVAKTIVDSHFSDS